MAHKTDVGAADKFMGAGRRRSSGARHWFIVAKRILATRVRGLYGGHGHLVVPRQRGPDVSMSTRRVKALGDRPIRHTPSEPNSGY